MDITLLTSQGIVKWVAQEIEYATNPRNDFKYFIKFIMMEYHSEYRYMRGLYRVRRQVLQDGEYIDDISYHYEAIANDTTFVDKNGNIVEESDPNKWGTEFERMQVLFNAPVADSDIVEGYQQELFDRGTFDFPKNRQIN